MVSGPLHRVRCTVCGGGAFCLVATSDEIHAQQEWLRAFHLRRMRRAALARGAERALFDRGKFTQDYATDVVRCRRCGLLMRNPRPPAERVTEAYAHDRYG